MSQIRVQDTNGNGIGDINIRISEGTKSSDEAIFDYKTNDDGSQTWPIPYWGVQDYTLHVNKRYVNEAYGTSETYVPKPVSGEYGDIGISLALQPLAPVEVRGVDFISNGKRLILSEVTNFLQFYRFKRQEDMTPTLYPGFNMDRVTLSMKWVPEQLGWPVLDMVNDPAFQPLLRDFLTWKRSVGRRSELTVVCDRRDLGRDQQWAARLLNLTYEVVQDLKENVVEFGNEVLDGEQMLDLPYLVANVNRHGVVSCSGSPTTGSAPPEPYLDYCANHLRRDSLSKMLADGNYGEQVYGSWDDFHATHRPMLTNEMKGAGEQESGSRYTDTNIALECGRIFASRCGGCFHATDAVFSRPLGPTQERCRQAFIDGITCAKDKN